MATSPNKSPVVFVSADVSDCADSLYAVNRVVMQLGGLPVSTFFGVQSGEYDWKVVREAIDKCDVYLILVGDSYGILSDSGESFIHREAVYAKSKQKKVVALLKNTELKGLSEASVQRLKSLHRLMMSGTFKYWNTKEDILLLARQVLRAYLKPQLKVGLNSQNVTESKRVQQAITDTLFNMGSYPLRFTGKVFAHGNCHDVELIIDMTWESAFLSIGTLMVSPVTEDRIRSALQSYIEEAYQEKFLEVVNDGHAVGDVRCNEIEFQRLKAYLKGAGVIENVASGQSGLRNYWQLTHSGERKLQKLLVAS
jgi:hypothetical protein